MDFLYPHQVLAKLKKSNFTLLNQSIQFDENGDPKFGSYSIIFWNDTGDAEEIGFYHFHSPHRLSINNTKIQWYTNGEVSCQCWILTVCKVNFVRMKNLDDSAKYQSIYWKYNKVTQQKTCFLQVRILQKFSLVHFCFNSCKILVLHRYQLHCAP